MRDPLQRSVRAIAAASACAVMLAPWPASAAHAASVKVTSITLHEFAGETQISIATSAPARYQLRDVQPEWVVIDILGAELGMRPGRVPLVSGGVSQVRVGQFNADVVRVVVEMTARVPTDVRPSPDGTALIVGIAVRAMPSQKAPAAAVPRNGVRNGTARITAIMLWGTPSRPWLSISASGPVGYQLRSLAPDRVAVDVLRAQLALAHGKPPIGRGLIQQIRVGQFAADVVRVVLDLTEAIPVRVAMSPDRSAIIVRLASAAVTRADVKRPQHLDGTSPVAAQRPAARPRTANAQPPDEGTSTSHSIPSPPASAHSSASPFPDGGYLLGPEDVLEISVWGYPDMRWTVPVRPDGLIAVPLAGTVPAAGRSVERLTQGLTRAFARYIVNPQVAVIVKEFRKIRVSVLGQVTHPGAYTLPPGARVLDAISMASGVNENAALPQAQLTRASGETQPLGLDGLLLRQDMSQNLVMEPGDTIIIPEDNQNKFYVLGDVNHAGIYPLKGEVTVLQALAIAGGLVLHGQSAATTAYIVRRVNPAEIAYTASVRTGDVQQIPNGHGVMVTMDLQKMMHGDLRQNENLRPGDVMVVPAPGAAGWPTFLSFLQTILIPLRF